MPSRIGWYSGISKRRSQSWHGYNKPTPIAQIYIPYDSKTGLIAQFDGFFHLKDIDLRHYEPRDRSIQAVLGIEETNQRQVLKQPDVLMLLYLMRDQEMRDQDKTAFPNYANLLQKNWDYYAPRTDITDGSSLISAIHAIFAADLGKVVEAEAQFMEAALVDLEDNRGNTEDGIHAASAGGGWQTVVFGFGLSKRLPRRICYLGYLSYGMNCGNRALKLRSHRRARMQKP